MLILKYRKITKIILKGIYYKFNLGGGIPSPTNYSKL